MVVTWWIVAFSRSEDADFAGKNLLPVMLAFSKIRGTFKSLRSHSMVLVHEKQFL